MIRLKPNSHPLWGIKNVPLTVRDTYKRHAKALNASQAELLTYIAEQLDKGKIKIK